MNSLRFTAIGLMILSLPGLAQQAAPANPLSSDGRSAWEYVRNFVLLAAEKMPEENYAFKPVPEVRSFGQLIGHIADGQLTLCAAAKGVPRPDVQARTKTTKADLVSALKESSALCDSAFVGLTDTKAAEILKVFGLERARLSVLYMNIGQTNEHYGNIVTYMRLKGLVPPSSEPRPR